MKEENKEVIEIEDIKELKDIVENLPEDAIVSLDLGVVIEDA